MDFSTEQRTVRLSVGEFSAFTLGPHDAGGGQQGLWRARLGTHWHQQLRIQVAAEHAGAQFEVAIDGQVFHRGWVFHFNGRIDQLLRAPELTILREIKTVTRALPADKAELRSDYPEYFVQLATYGALFRIVPAAGAAAVRAVQKAELVFVEAGSGLTQTIALTPADDALFRAQLDRVADFLEQRRRARARLRQLGFRPAFAAPRPGQETTRAELTAEFEGRPLVLFEAPTGFGKTGVLLEFALGQLRAGHFERVLYLTSKSTGQLQVVRTLTAMTEDPRRLCHPWDDKIKTSPDDAKTECHLIDDTRSEAVVASSGIEGGQVSAATLGAATSVAAWHVRNKSEHCINHTFHCVRENCAYLDGVAARWPQSGLSRFYLLENQARDLETLRAAGREARICPYEITRAALAFNDVWVADYNYVFAPNNRGLFFLQPGFDPARTLLLLDEAHNLPSRVADAYSHVARADDARSLLAELDHVRAPAPLVRAWESWTLLLSALPATDALDPALEADAADTLIRIADQLATLPVDYALLGPRFSELLWQSQQLAEWLGDARLKKLLWSPRGAELHFTCIDAAEAIGASLREFGGVVFASATLSPVGAFAESCGLEDAGNRISEAGKENTVPAFAHLRAHTPWREAAYDVAVDARVDTSFQQRSKHQTTTAATIVALQESARGPVAVFFPSYAYAENIARELERVAPALRAVVQPKLRDLAAQSAWVEESLALSDALFLVLGSSFTESIDALGGRVTHAMVVGPALPEVNAVQRARLAEFSALGREAAFRRVYQIPGMAKVNQALGRLVRAPGQRARVILHCRRFLEPSYASLLAPEYQFGANVLTDADLSGWLSRARSSF